MVDLGDLAVDVVVVDLGRPQGEPLQLLDRQRGADLLERSVPAASRAATGEKTSRPRKVRAGAGSQCAGSSSTWAETAPPAASHAWLVSPLSGATNVEPSAVRTATPRTGLARNGSTSARCTDGCGR